jgi:hypothetical protein
MLVFLSFKINFPTVRLLATIGPCSQFVLPVKLIEIAVAIFAIEISTRMTGALLQVSGATISEAKTHSDNLGHRRQDIIQPHDLSPGSYPDPDLSFEATGTVELPQCSIQSASEL